MSANPCAKERERERGERKRGMERERVRERGGLGEWESSAGTMLRPSVPVRPPPPAPSFPQPWQAPTSQNRPLPPSHSPHFTSCTSLACGPGLRRCRSLDENSATQWRSALRRCSFPPCPSTSACLACGPPSSAQRIPLGRCLLCRVGPRCGLRGRAVPAPLGRVDEKA